VIEIWLLMMTQFAHPNGTEPVNPPVLAFADKAACVALLEKSGHGACVHYRIEQPSQRCIEIDPVTTDGSVHCLRYEPETDPQAIVR
jgi:hypothetical protein